MSGFLRKAEAALSVICIAVYIFSALYAVFSIVKVCREQKQFVEREFSELKDYASSAAVLGISSPQFKKDIKDALLLSKTLHAVIITGPKNFAVAIEKTPDLVKWKGDYPLFNEGLSLLGRIGFEPLNVRDLNSVGISALAAFVDFDELLYILRRSLIFILIAVTLSFAMLIIEFCRKQPQVEVRAFKGETPEKRQPSYYRNEREPPVEERTFRPAPPENGGFDDDFDGDGEKFGFDEEDEVVPPAEMESALKDEPLNLGLDFESEDSPFSEGAWAEESAAPEGEAEDSESAGDFDFDWGIEDESPPGSAAEAAPQARDAAKPEVNDDAPRPAFVEKTKDAEEDAPPVKKTPAPQVTAQAAKPAAAPRKPADIEGEAEDAAPSAAAPDAGAEADSDAVPAASEERAAAPDDGGEAPVIGETPAPEADAEESEGAHINDDVEIGDISGIDFDAPEVPEAEADEEDEEEKAEASPDDEGLQPDALQADEQEAPPKEVEEDFYEKDNFLDAEDSPDLSFYLEPELKKAEDENADLSLLSAKWVSTDAPQELLVQTALKVLKEGTRVFEKASQGIFAVIPGLSCEDALKEAREFYRSALAALPSEQKEQSALFIGISARSGRKVDVRRLINESESALAHAFEDEKQPIVTFKVDLKKYNEFIAGKS